MGTFHDSWLGEMVSFLTLPQEGFTVIPLLGVMIPFVPASLTGTREESSCAQIVMLISEKWGKIRVRPVSGPYDPAPKARAGK